MSSGRWSSSETFQENLGFGYIAWVVTLSLGADIFWQVHLGEVLSSHVAQISLHGMS